jgi:hypothetical protein
MPIIEALLNELEQEAKTTARVLARVPAEHLAWRPHPKSFSLGQLAMPRAQFVRSIMVNLRPSRRWPAGWWTPFQVIQVSMSAVGRQTPSTRSKTTVPPL